MSNKIYLAGGCFWGVEEYFRRTEGILATSVGYINSCVINPSYQEVCQGNTQAVEGVELEYDPKKISREEILDHFYHIIDPFSLNKQGNDRGTQYRTGLYYTSEEEREFFSADRQRRQKKFDRPIQVEIEPLENYYFAEESHQQYLEKNPGGYCHIILPKK